MKKRESEFLTYEEIQALLKMPDMRTLEGKRDYSILLTMLTTGLRKAELCNLKGKDIKTYRNQIVIDVIGKGKRHRRIGLKHSVYKAIQAYTKTHGNKSPDHVIFYTLGKHGLCKVEPLSHKAVDCIIKKYSRMALLKKRVSPHTLRHTFATSLLDAGVDLKTVQELMGHSHIRTTERYLHSNDDKKFEAINRLQFG
tara:strand:+ start:53 stop:643 length:591 start_codon:yes stop_codon:yes gene_type:complete